jgi:hypothetical protein
VMFAGCLRSHGVPGFPDPTSPQEFKSSLGGQQKSPAIQSAESTCRHLLPGGPQGRGGPESESPERRHARTVAALAFARCLRGHGFANFPDPTSNGDLTHEMLANAGIDIHLPALLQAADTCVSVTHGFLTRADVARFAAGQ